MSDSRLQVVERAFAGAADYDSHAKVQRLVARELARRIAGLPLPPRPRILEIGCGTGFLAEALHAQGLAGDWLVTDLSPTMVERAQMRLGKGLRYAVFDGEHGTPEGRSFDVVCASLATQWFGDEPSALERWREWLSRKGHVMVATLGPGTFAEWRLAHETEGLTPGTPVFTPLPALEALGSITVERLRERHQDAASFLRALHGIGANTPAAGHSPLSPSALRRVMRRFEAGGAIASYEIVTCHLPRATTVA